MAKEESSPTADYSEENLNANQKGKKGKKGKGKGKGEDGGKAGKGLGKTGSGGAARRPPPKTGCFICGGKHWASECPQNALRRQGGGGGERSNNLQEEPVLCCARECARAPESKVAYGDNRFKHLAQDEETEADQIPLSLVNSQPLRCDHSYEGCTEGACTIASPHSIARRWARNASHWTRAESRRSAKTRQANSERVLSSPTAENIPTPSSPGRAGLFQ